jgi:hypothetical protein
MTIFLLIMRLTKELFVLVEKPGLENHDGLENESNKNGRVSYQL